MNECELVTFVSTLACALAKNLTTDELGILASISSQLGDTLDTIITHRSICDAKDNKGSGDE